MGEHVIVIILVVALAALLELIGGALYLKWYEKKYERRRQHVPYENSW